MADGVATPPDSADFPEAFWLPSSPLRTSAPPSTSLCSAPMVGVTRHCRFSNWHCCWGLLALRICLQSFGKGSGNGGAKRHHRFSNSGASPSVSMPSLLEIPVSPILPPVLRQTALQFLLLWRATFGVPAIAVSNFRRTFVIASVF